MSSSHPASSPVPHIHFSHVDLASALTLSVGWRSGQKTKLRQIAIGGSVEDAFRAVLRTAVADLFAREEQAWAPDADLSPETYLFITDADLGPSPELAAEHAGDSLASALKASESLDAIHPSSLPTADLSFYTLTVGDVAGQRTTFLRRSNPRRGLKKGRIYTFLGDTLQTIEDPLFAFDERFDLVFAQAGVAVLSQTVFAAMFRDQDTLTAQIPTWVDDLHSAVALSSDGRTRLVDRSLRDTRLRARLEAIVRREHLSSVPVATMRSAMTDAGLDPDVLINPGGELTLEHDDIPQVLYFLNEDLFVGALTSTSFRADKKAAR